jgi:hypothetical protein
MGETPMPPAAGVVTWWIIAEPSGAFHPRTVIHRGIDAAVPLRGNNCMRKGFASDSGVRILAGAIQGISDAQKRSCYVLFRCRYSECDIAGLPQYDKNTVCC